MRTVSSRRRLLTGAIRSSNESPPASSTTSGATAVGRPVTSVGNWSGVAPPDDVVVISALLSFHGSACGSGEWTVGQEAPESPDRIDPPGRRLVCLDAHGSLPRSQVDNGLRGTLAA